MGNILSFQFDHLITAFPAIEVEADEGTVVDHYFGIHLNNLGIPEVNKGFNTPREGVCDRIITKTGNTNWSSFFSKGYQYHTVIVRTKNAGRVRVKAFETHYPVERRGSFHSDHDMLNKIWDVSEKTLRAGMLDAYVDNSWREQAQWLLDGVTSAQSAHALYGDTALFRRGLTNGVK